MVKKFETEKQLVAYWNKGSVVEIVLRIPRFDKKGNEYREPNHLRARCLTSGQFVTVEVLNDFDERHEDFPNVLESQEFAVWGYSFQRVYVLENEDDCVVIVGSIYKPPIKVIRKSTCEVLKDNFVSMAEAIEWVERYLEEGEVEYVL